MYTCLSPGTIGIGGISLPESIELARVTGFRGVGFSIREAGTLVEQNGLECVREMFDKAGVRPGTWGLPVAWNGPEEAWQRDLAGLPKLASVARDLGCTGTSTWCPPASNERDFEENLAWHVARFRPIAEVLRDEGCRLGIEFIGPKTLRTPMKYEFVYTLGGMMELAAAIGTGNVGLLLDAWHLYTSGGTVAALDSITPTDVVLVHVNDAPAGIERDAQLDNVRDLPMATGVINLPAFVRKLDAMGYSGPVVPEPFSARLNLIAATDPGQAAHITSDAMRLMWQESGLIWSEG